MLDPLFAVRRNATLSDDGYILVAKTWRHSIEKPSLAHLAVLREGVSFFPFNAELLRQAARAYAQWDYRAEAAALIDQGIPGMDAATAAELAAMKQSLAQN